MTHQDLVDRCGAWLTKCKTHKCNIVFKEVHSYISEIPDVIGFKNIGDSVMIEVKVSRGDFLGDFKKKHRKTPSLGMGSRRFYACPNGLIEPDEVPANWGLIWVYPTMIKIMKKPRKQEKNLKNEQLFLISALRKVNFVTPVEETLTAYTQGFKELTKGQARKAKRSCKRSKRAVKRRK